MRVRLLPGTSVDQAIQEFRYLADNVYSATSLHGAIVDIADRIDAYVEWSLSTELRLAVILGRPAALDLLDSPRHQALCSMLPVRQAVRLLNSEIDAKANQFRGLVEELQAEKRKMAGSPGCPVVLDSNVLLQAKRPDQIPWTAVLGEDAVRLMIPLRVIEELDAKKYGESKRLRGVARTVLPWLEGLFPDSQPGPVGLPDQGDTTVEVLLVDAPRRRPTDADEEILDACQDIVHLAGRATLVTADTGMRLRARAQQLRVESLPSEYLRLPDES